MEPPGDVEFVAFADQKNCNVCTVKFGLIRRKQHCGICGQVVCNKCAPSKTWDRYNVPVCACTSCREDWKAENEVSVAKKAAAVQTARSLKEEARQWRRLKTIQGQVYYHNKVIYIVITILRVTYSSKFNYMYR